MGDPLSIAAGTAGFISLGIQVTSSLVQFYTSHKSRDSDVIRISSKLEILLETLRALETVLLNRKFRADEQDLLHNVETTLQACKDLIEELRDEAQKFSKTSTVGHLERIKTESCRFTYPFRQSTLLKLDEDIAEIRSNLSFVLDVLQLKGSSRSENDLEEIRSLLELVSARQISSSIRDWLKAPDPTINHNEACLKRHLTSGLWFVKGLTFKSWLDEDNSFLWLNGFAGCGKSILCSTVIQHTFRHRRSNPRIGIAFFYFDFNDDSKQDLLSMLRSLLLQLSNQLPGGHDELEKLRSRYSNGLPPIPLLLDYLQYIIKLYKDVYIIIDAIDESPKSTARELVLDTLCEMRKWSIRGFHLLVTSRDEPDIREALEASPEEDILIKNSGVEKDIAEFISYRLGNDRKLRRWSASHDRIQKALVERAQGVFRWVECQFKSLRDCPGSEHHLEKLLTSLPRTLDKTYERMLCNVDDTLVEDATRILTLLCLASRPLTIRELIDGIAVDIGDQKRFQVSRRLKDEDDIHRICPGLVEIRREPDRYVLEQNVEDFRRTFHIAHFSVQEYLESGRIEDPRAARFGIERAKAHDEVASICLIYLCNTQMSYESKSEVYDRYPLSMYAASHWYHHHKSAADPKYLSEQLVLDFFQNQHIAFRNWVRLQNIDYLSPGLDLNNPDIQSPIYYASILGLTDVLYQLLENLLQSERNHIESQSKLPLAVTRLINAQGGSFGTALQAASYHGHKSIVPLLLANGADINTQEGIWGSALHAASHNSHESLVELLLANGADINAQGGYFGTALQAASYNGHKSLVELLLANGADINAQGREFGTALQAASIQGHKSIIELLLANGAIAIDWELSSF